MIVKLVKVKIYVKTVHKDILYQQMKHQEYVLHVSIHVKHVLARHPLVLHVYQEKHKEDLNAEIILTVNSR